jgi:hypothetical protein
MQTPIKSRVLLALIETGRDTFNAAGKEKDLNLFQSRISSALIGLMIS